MRRDVKFSIVLLKYKKNKREKLTSDINFDNHVVGIQEK